MPGMPSSSLLRIATYNIHKGVQGIGPARRLEIHNLGLAVEQLDADIVCLQEVRKLHHRGPHQFPGWPEQPQADYLAPEGYEAVYRTNAVTRHGEHGNALLSRWPVIGHQHEDISDHRFEQRGLLHVEVDIDGLRLHAIVVHLGLVPGSRLRQVLQLHKFIEREVPAGAPLVVAGDFNDWRGRAHEVLRDGAGLQEVFMQGGGKARRTFPASLPVLQLDRIYVRNAAVLTPVQLPRLPWSRLSDHAPLAAEIAL